MLRAILGLVSLVVLTVGLGLPVTILTLFLRDGDLVLKAGRLWSRLNLAACGIRPDYRRPELLTRSMPCVYVSNHQSIADIWVLIAVLPSSVRFVAKESLFRIPVFGWALRAGGFIPIDRANRQAAIRSLEVAAERVRAGHPVLLFPEGTRSRDGTLLPFKKGAFHLALGARAPLVPITIRGSHLRLPADTYRVRPGRLEVVIGEPVDPAPYQPADVDGLLAAVRERIAAGLGGDPVTDPR